MKMKLYYVAKRCKGDGEYYYDYIAGPFSFDGAYENKNRRMASYNYYVVERIVEVEY